MQLFEHNRTAYEAAVAMLAETGKAAVIHPTGTGKSFIGFKLCEDYPDSQILWLSPSDYICRTQLENWAAAGGEPLSNVTFLTYAKLMYMDSDALSVIHPDFIVLDEFHRAGAEVWGAGVKRLIELFPAVPLLGLSATNIRYLDNQRDMAEELFDNCVAARMTLGEAIVRGILHPPKYILSVYSYQKDLEKYEKRVRSAKSKAVRDAASACLEALRRALEHAEGLDVIFDRHMTDRHGKYIVFTPNYESMQEYMALAKEWFGKIDREMHIYSVYSDDPSASKEFHEFRADDSDHLRLLYCIDALNEGVHPEDISGVILLRPTVSPIIYKQQIGRALSASKSREPVIFDVVNNIENLFSIDAIEEEMRSAACYYRSRGEEGLVVSDSFEIVDRMAECRELFEQLEGTLTASWDIMYAAAERYYREHGNLDPPKRWTTEEGYSLGSWLTVQRRVRAGKTYGILTDAQIAQLDRIGMRWDSVKNVAWNRYYAAALGFYQENHSLDVNARYVTADGVRLGAWLAQLRTARKIGLNSSYLTPERIAQLDALGMVWDVYDFVFERNYHAAVRYYREHGDLNCPCDYTDSEGIRLGTWLNYLRQQYRKRGRQLLTEEQFQQLVSVGMQWGNKYDLQWEAAFAELTAYLRKTGNVQVPADFVTEGGIRLGAWVRRQIDGYHSGKLRADRTEKLEQLGIVWDSDPWEEKFRLAKVYSEAHGGISDIKPDCVVNGIWLHKWLNEQRLSGEGKRRKKLTDEQRQKLESIGMVFGQTQIDQAWETHFLALKDYVERTGTAEIPEDLCDTDGVNLKGWLKRQIAAQRNGKLSAERVDRLRQLGLIPEEADSFETGFQHAKAYFEEHGNLLVKAGYVCKDGFNLNSWITRARYNRKKGRLTAEQIESLDGIGMVWDATEFVWMEMFEAAKAFYVAGKTLTIPYRYRASNGKDLYEWYIRQRRMIAQGKLSAEKIAKLLSIGADLAEADRRRTVSLTERTARSEIALHP